MTQTRTQGEGKGMETYFNRIEDDVRAAYDVAEQARGQGKDPEPHVDIPIAEDLPEKAENLVCAALYPDMKEQGIKQRIRELEEAYGKKDERVALTIGKEIAANTFYEFDELEDAVDAGIRVGLAYLTGAVVTAPLDGIADVKIRENDDGTNYLAVYYAGPIRSAGGTASALSVLLADYVRKEAGLDEYKPRDEELDRYAVEVEDYVMRVTKKQYTPARKETRMIADNVPVEVTGIPTEGDLEVSSHKDLDRVDTNVIRGGMCLVYLDGLPLKASKMLRRLDSFGDEFGLSHWYWLDDYLDLQKQLKSEDTNQDEEEDDEEEAEEKKEPRRSAAYLENVVGGRPVFSHPGRVGGFRLRYGRSRSTGLAAYSFHPATMELVDGFLAVGTQLKMEYPGKGTVSTPCDTIEGPVVRLKNGDVKRIETREDAEQVKPYIDTILFLGDILIPYGEFLENGKKLLPAGYCEEWWAEEVTQADLGVETDLAPYMTKPFETPPPQLAISLAKKHGVPLHPAYTYHWHHLDRDAFTTLLDNVHTDTEAEDEVHVNTAAKNVLETLAVPHTVEDDTVIVEPPDSHILTTLLHPDKEVADQEDPVTVLEQWNSIELREKAPTFLGARMGRPEKVGKRQLKGSPQVLFPCGHRAGGRMRNLMETYKQGEVRTDVCLNHCPECDEKTPFSYCPYCGDTADELYKCRDCGTYVKEEEHCGEPAYRHSHETIPVKKYVDLAAENVEFPTLPDLLKSPRGMSGRHRHVEPIEKGLLRQYYDLYVNKDGTIRFDATDLTLTHFKPGEISTSISRLKELGYTHDIHGQPLEEEDQVLALKPQDIVVTDNPGDESGADHLYNVSRFVDDLLEKFYDLDPYYEAGSKQDLVGSYVIGLAPHTSGGIVGRIIGFNQAKGIYAHPYWHAAKRRNCFHPNTEIWYKEDGEWRQEPIQDAVEQALENPEEDAAGTQVQDVDNWYAPSVDANGEFTVQPVDAVSKHPAPDHLIRIETETGETLTVTSDHDMQIYTENGEVEKKSASQVAEDDRVPRVGEDVTLEEEANPEPVTVSNQEIVRSDISHTYCITVEDTHSVVAEGIATGQCDGDEDSILLLMDALLNFSRQFLPDYLGGRSMDAPLILASRLRPDEVDEESWNVDTATAYPPAFYEATYKYKKPGEVEDLVEIAEHNIEQGEPFKDGFTHDTTDIAGAPTQTTYVTFTDMTKKVRTQLELGERIQAVDEHDVAERILSDHFFSDLLGNLRAFSEQRFRCTDCNEMYRRVPLAGVCTNMINQEQCNGKLLLTVYEGTIRKYLAPSEEIADKYQISTYLRQQISMVREKIQSLFGKAERQTNLMKFND